MFKFATHCSLTMALVFPGSQMPCHPPKWLVTSLWIQYLTKDS